MKQAESLAVMLKIIYYLHKPVGEVGALSSQGYGRRMSLTA